MSSQIEFKYCSFSENLIKKVFVEQPVEGTAFIFPTESNRRLAIKELQRTWTFTGTLLTTMEAFKELLFFSDRPLLKEEKRILAFYASLTEEDKKKFNVHSYFQSIELAQQFFDLWQEFNEELVDEKIEARFTPESGEILAWQLDTYRRLRTVKTQYQAFLREKGFDDVLFTHKPDRIQFQELANYNRFVFVNQFYYTGLEKSIIQRLRNETKDVCIYYQLPAGLVNTKNLEISNFSLNDLQDWRAQKVHIIECSNDFSMLTAALNEVDQNHIQHLVDVAFLKRHYDRFLALDKFNLGSTLRFEQSSIYRFFSTLHSLISSLIREPNREKFLLPLQPILDAVLSREFFSYFFPRYDNERIALIQEQTLNYLYDLIDYGYKYIDLEQEFFQLRPNEHAAPIQDLLRLLEQTLQISSISDFIAGLDSSNGIQIRQIVTTEEERYSDLLNSFYRLLSDFAAIENIGLVAGWKDYFGAADPHLRPVRLAGGILRLFLDYMKPRRIRLDYSLEKAGRIEITELIDTRNIEFNQVAILNVVEGQLPSSRLSPFIFTEQQRRILGLKTFEDVKLWEKYYFLRLVLNSTEAFLFTKNDIQENVTVSSFLEEIKLYFPRERLELRREEEPDYKSIFRHFLFPDKDYLVGTDSLREPGFFAIPVDTARDFPKGRIELTYQALKSLQDNPFVYFIRHLSGIKERTKQVEVEFSDQLVGNIVHEILIVFWNILDEAFAGPLFGYDFSRIDKKTFDRALRNITGERLDYYFRMPHSHSAIYFEHVLAPLIRQGIDEFFLFLHQLGLSNKAINLIPEGEFSSSAEQKFKTFLKSNENALNLEVKLRGRADLRIELSEEKRYLIFDYKTGKTFDARQLLIYELFYYALDKPQLLESISSYFIHVLDYRQDELRSLYRSNRTRFKSKQEMIADFLSGVQDALSLVKEKGFALPEKKTFLEDMAEVTRKDLFLMNRKSPSHLQDV
jgi:hypothetical protein